MARTPRFRLADIIGIPNRAKLRADVVEVSSFALFKMALQRPKAIVDHLKARDLRGLSRVDAGFRLTITQTSHNRLHVVRHEASAGLFDNGSQGFFPLAFSAPREPNMAVLRDVQAIMHDLFYQAVVDFGFGNLPSGLLESA